LLGGSFPPRRVGKRVWLWNAQCKRPSGTAAQYISIASQRAVRLRLILIILQAPASAFRHSQVIEVDFAANAPWLPSLLRPHWIVVSMAPAEPAIAALWMLQNTITTCFFLVYELSPQDRCEGLAELGHLLEGDRLIHAIGRRLPLADAIEAHECLERGDIIGDVVLDIP
jgi:NADPH:quinone reductase-like Zn-dependent oxidoreductase